MGIRFRKQTRQPFRRGRGAVCFNQSPWVSGSSKADFFYLLFPQPPLFPSVPLICCSQNSPRSSSTSISSLSSHLLQMGLLANPADTLFSFFPSPSVWFSLSGACCLEPGCLGWVAGGKGPSHCQRSVSDFLEQVVGQTPPNRLSFSLRSEFVLARSAV